jgi:hypothetical protein
MASTGLKPSVEREARRRSEVELEVFDVGELDFEAVGAAAAVAEVHLAQCLGRDVAQLLFRAAGFLGLEEAGGVLRGQSDGEMAQPGVVGGAGGRRCSRTGRGSR